VDWRNTFWMWIGESAGVPRFCATALLPIDMYCAKPRLNEYVLLTLHNFLCKLFGYSICCCFD
jgi:hypothetical protein